MTLKVVDWSTPFSGPRSGVAGMTRGADDGQRKKAASFETAFALFSGSLRTGSVGGLGLRATDRDRGSGGGGGAALDRLQEVGRLHEGDRVHGFAVEAHLVMEVAAGRTAGRAH